MSISRIKEYLQENNVAYQIIPHLNVYTAQEVASVAHISGKEIAKTIILKVDGQMVMAVLPATDKVDLQCFCEVMRTTHVEVAEEEEFQNIFWDCELGAMAPLGPLYNMDVFVSKRLTEDDQIAFNADTHTDLVRISYHDFEKLVNPKIFDFSKAFAAEHR